MTKICTSCRIDKETTEFYSHKWGKSGVASRCKKCRNSESAAYRKLNPEKMAAQARKWRNNNKKRHLNNVLMLKFKISVDAYERMYKEQNGCCAICESLSISGRRMAVDHNHSTGEIRGLLCDKCNRGIGFLKDSIHNLQKAVNYLERFSPRDSSLAQH